MARREELIEQLAAIEHEWWSDGGQVARYWPVLVEFVAEWIEHQGQVEHEILPIEASHLSDKWREEMRP